MILLISKLSLCFYLGLCLFMKIILLRKIKNLGNIGDIKEVADGHALNFLLPQKLAEQATQENINKLNNHKAAAIKKAEEDLTLAQQLAQKLRGMIIEMKGKCNEEGRLYSAVSCTMIANKLKEQGINIASKQVNLIKPIKELGEYSVFIVLNHGLEAEITVIVK